MVYSPSAGNSASKRSPEVEPMNSAVSEAGGSTLKYADRLLDLKMAAIVCPALARTR